jgi:hypothetical protein
MKKTAVQAVFFDGMVSPLNTQMPMQGNNSGNDNGDSVVITITISHETLQKIATHLIGWMTAAGLVLWKYHILNP